MLFHSSIRRELARSFGATLLVLFTIVLTMLLIGVLGQANKGRIDPQEFVPILTYTLIGRAPTILTIALFVAIASTLTRMYRDSEMVIWMNAGKGLAHFLSPVTQFAWPVVLLIAALVLWAWPWSNQQINTLKDRFERRGDLERVIPGQFTELSGGRRVFFVEKSEVAEQGGQNILIVSREMNNQEAVTTAQYGQIIWQGDRQLLSLSAGQKIDRPLDAGTRDMRISEFGAYDILIEDKTLEREGTGGLNSMPTLELLDTSNRFYAAELGWRLGIIFTAMNFVLLTLGIATGNARAGKSSHIFMLLATFIVYFNLLNIGQSWVINQSVHWLSALLFIHGSVLTVAALLLVSKHFNIHLFGFFKASKAS